MKDRFRLVKDALAFPLLAGIRMSSSVPGAQQVLFGGVSAALRFSRLVPGSHVRRTIRDYCRVVGCDDPARVFADSVRKITLLAELYGDLMRNGPERMARMAVFDPGTVETCERLKAQGKGGIFVLPHCIGSPVAAVGFARRFPSLLLITESRSVTRTKLTTDCFAKMGAEVAYVRRGDPAAAARSILRALHEGKFIIGTTDILRRTRDSALVRMFGQPAHLPAWPARFSARRDVPIIPAFVYLEGERICFCIGEPYIEPDMTIATQRWADFFGLSFRRYPSEWLFLYEKRWAQLIAQAAEAARCEQ